MNKKINTYRLIIGFCLLSFGMLSCSEWLDVKPKSEIKEDELFKTEQGFKDAMGICTHDRGSIVWSGNDFWVGGNNWTAV